MVLMAIGRGRRWESVVDEDMWGTQFVNSESDSESDFVWCFGPMTSFLDISISAAKRSGPNLFTINLGVLTFLCIISVLWS